VTDWPTARRTAWREQVQAVAIDMRTVFKAAIREGQRPGMAATHPADQVSSPDACRTRRPAAVTITDGELSLHPARQTVATAPRRRRGGTREDDNQSDPR
jgi:hypothetical protein